MSLKARETSVSLREMTGLAINKKAPGSRRPREEQG
jgi:hypothetical protein